MLMPTSDTSPLLSYPSRSVTLPCPISQMKTTEEKTGVQGIRIFLMLYRTDRCGKAGQFFGPPFSAIISVPLLYRHRQRMRNSPSIQSEPRFSIPPFIFFWTTPFLRSGKNGKRRFHIRAPEHNNAFPPFRTLSYPKRERARVKNGGNGKGRIEKARLKVHHRRRAFKDAFRPLLFFLHTLQLKGCLSAAISKKLLLLKHFSSRF